MGYTIKDILRMEVAPALGCTEPAAVALCAAAAASLLTGQKIESIEIWVDSNVYKNGMAVSIPGAEGSLGINVAAAMGVFGGDANRKLEVLETIGKEDLKTAKQFVKDGKVKINLLEKQEGLYIRTCLHAGSGYAEAVIQDLHDNIVCLSMNGKAVESHPLLSVTEKAQNEVYQLEEWLSGLSLEELVCLLDDLDEDDLRFIEEGVETNMRLADYGLTYGPGLGVGLALERLVREGLLNKDMILAARILTSGASDARMSGAKLPAMSSAGSGNHGLTAILPIWAVKDYLSDVDHERVLKSIALSHVITAYIKAHTGRLSAICGCSVAAGAGATGGITYLMGGNLHHIAGAIKNLVGDLAGVICDGAKSGCALKLATAAGTAVQSALLSLHGIDVKGTDGIISASPEQTMKNVGKLSTQGMIETDRTILNIMVKKQFDNI